MLAGFVEAEIREKKSSLSVIVFIKPVINTGLIAIEKKNNISVGSDHKPTKLTNSNNKDCLVLIEKKRKEIIKPNVFIYLLLAKSEIKKHIYHLMFFSFKKNFFAVFLRL